MPNPDAEFDTKTGRLEDRLKRVLVAHMKEDGADPHVIMLALAHILGGVALGAPEPIRALTAVLDHIVNAHYVTEQPICILRELPLYKRMVEGGVIGDRRGGGRG